MHNQYLPLHLESNEDTEKQKAIVLVHLLSDENEIILTTTI